MVGYLGYQYCEIHSLILASEDLVTMNRPDTQVAQDAIESLIAKLTSKQQELSHLENKHRSRQHSLRGLQNESATLDQLKKELETDNVELQERNKELSNQVNLLRRQYDISHKNKCDLKITIDCVKKTVEDLTLSIKSCEEDFDEKCQQKRETIQDIRKLLMTFEQ